MALASMKAARTRVTAPGSPGRTRLGEDPRRDGLIGALANLPPRSQCFRAVRDGLWGCTACLKLSCKALGFFFFCLAWKSPLPSRDGDLLAG